jgi:hypothetical protein
MLARMLDAEVAVPRGLERYVVTARGLQRGVGATERGSFPTYGRLWTSRPYLLRTLARGEEPRRTDIGDTYRASVNQMLEAKGLSSEVAALIRAGDELGLELARGWTHVDVTAALREMVATGPKPDAALDALFARHTFSPGPELATVLLDPVVSRRVAQLFRGQRYPDGTSYGKSSEAADFLAAFPAGSWARAIVTLAREMGQEHHDLFDFVNARRDRIEEADRESVDAFCRDHVGATDAPRPSVLEYLAWREPHARAAT